MENQQGQGTTPVTSQADPMATPQEATSVTSAAEPMAAPQETSAAATAPTTTMVKKKGKTVVVVCVVLVLLLVCVAGAFAGYSRYISKQQECKEAAEKAAQHLTNAASYRAEMIGSCVIASKGNFYSFESLAEATGIPESDLIDSLLAVLGDDFSQGYMIRGSDSTYRDLFLVLYADKGAAFTVVYNHYSQYNELAKDELDEAQKYMDELQTLKDKKYYPTLKELQDVIEEMDIDVSEFSGKPPTAMADKMEEIASGGIPDRAIDILKQVEDLFGIQ